MIPNAIIIHGPGRSGTTLLSNILSLHPDLGWISGYIDYFPQQSFLSVFNRIQDIKTIENFSRGRKKYPRPGETYKFWKHYFPDFNSPAAYKTSVDNADNKPQQCIQAIESILKYSGKQRFITKITGLPRNRQLAQVFENPYVIYINRDPRAVVMSYYKQRWGYKTEPETFKGIPFEKHIEVYTERYRASWDGVKELKKFQLLLVNYEDLVKEPDNFFDKILEFTRLEKSPKFVQMINSWKIRGGTNDAWREKLSSEQIEIVEEHLKDLLVETGYEKSYQTSVPSIS